MLHTMSMRCHVFFPPRLFFFSGTGYKDFLVLVEALYVWYTCIPDAQCMCVFTYVSLIFNDS